MDNLIKSLNWRYATKKFDANKKLSNKEVDDLCEVLRLTPSSYGLQPWKFILVEDVELRRRIKEASWNQPQPADASHLFVLCTRTDLDEDYIKRYVDFTSKETGAPRDKLNAVEQMMVDFRKDMTDEQMIEWGKKQVYLACGFILMACATKNIDASPMEGFDSKKVDEILGLKDMKLTSTLLVPVGHRVEDDRGAKTKKVRFSKEDVLLQR